MDGRMEELVLLPVFRVTTNMETWKRQGMGKLSGKFHCIYER